MAGNLEDLRKWALEKAEEYLESAKSNLEEGRLYVAAEEAFRTIENSLESMLYSQGISKISYPGKEKEFTGRLALQLLIRDNLLPKQLISKEDYKAYFANAAELHQAQYKYGKFEEKTVRNALTFAEIIFNKAQLASK